MHKVSITGIVFGCLMATTALSERGRDGQVNVIYSQAPSIMNPYLSGGAKDIEASSLVLEPLARYNSDGEIVPWLVEDIPTLDNGGINQDMTQITWRLKSGIKWSDGTDLTSRDVKFSWEYCTAGGGGCAQVDKFKDVTSVETPDDATVVVTFSKTKPFPYGPFVGSQAPVIQAAQFENCLGASAPSCADANFAPFGTGPFYVTDFRPNDVVVFEANPHFRDPAKPAFDRVVLKGGGNAAEAGRTVLQTGEFDYAWNLQLAPEVLSGMQSVGKGTVVSAFGTLVERMVFNFTNPDAALGADRATLGHPHPALTDKSVRHALALALDRPLMVEIGYGVTGRTTCNILPAPPAYLSNANDDCVVQDLDTARAILDTSGWIDNDGDGIRDRDGVKLSFVFQTSTNAVRQDFQALVKDWWRQIGVDTQLRNVDPSVFFGSDPGSPDTFQKFFADVQMFAGNFDGTDPEAYMAGWSCQKAPTPDNQWQGSNVGRWCSEDYDRLVDQMASTGAPADRAALAIKMNDMLVQDFAVVPLVDRGRVSAHSNTLGGVDLNMWDSELWNVADWYRISQ